MTNPHAVALGQCSSPQKAASSRLNGTLGGRPAKTPITVEEFWAPVQHTICGCWLRGNPRYPLEMYSSLIWNGRSQAVHRIAFQLTHGPIPDGMIILHVCDVAGCLNPDHLRLGTHKENTQDMLAKGPVALRPVRDLTTTGPVDGTLQIGAAKRP